MDSSYSRGFFLFLEIFFLLHWCWGQWGSGGEGENTGNAMVSSV
jgi:hypothetical protein